MQRKVDMLRSMALGYQDDHSWQPGLPNAGWCVESSSGSCLCRLRREYVAAMGWDSSTRGFLMSVGMAGAVSTSGQDHLCLCCHETVRPAIG